MGKRHRLACRAISVLALGVVLAFPTGAGADGFAYKTKTFSNPAGFNTFNEVKCRSKPVVGGGTAATDPADQWLLASAPTANLSLAVPRNSWLGVFENTNQVTAHDMTVTAICEKRGGDRFVYRTRTFPNPPNSEATGSVGCKGEPVVGGGVFPIDIDVQVSNISRPTGRGRGWHGGVFNFANDRHTLVVTAICEKHGSDRFVERARTDTVPAASGMSLSVGCGSKHLVGGGFEAGDDPLDQRVTASTPTAANDGWSASVHNYDMSAAHDFTVIAICEKR